MIARFVLFWAAVTIAVIAYKFFTNGEEKLAIANIIWKGILAGFIAILIIIPLFFLNNLSGL